MQPIITLTTDFGSGSPYVAQMKGVMLSRCREAALVDITHAIGPQNIREGAIVLADATASFPAGTIHVAVVDPGVGTARRIIYAQIGEQQYLAPDNGLLSYLARREQPQRVVALEDTQFWLPRPSHTFHGRDIFAPVAARLAAGLDPSKLGPPRDEIVLLEWTEPQVTSSRIVGETLYVDSFGNLITNITNANLDTLGGGASLAIECGGRTIQGVIATYAAAMPGELVTIIDSQGRLELAVVNGNAAGELHIAEGEPVIVTQS